MSKLPPRHPGYYLFRGTRCIRVGQYEHITDILKVVWLPHKQREMAAQMCGKQRYFPLAVFEGEWSRIELERIAA